MNIFLEKESESFPYRISNFQLKDGHGHFRWESSKDGSEAQSGLGKIKKIAESYYVHMEELQSEWFLIPNQVVTKFYDNDKKVNLYAGFMPSRSGGAAEGALVTNMPGKIVNLLVKEGDTVEEGQTLLIMEAMKMENEVKAPKSAKVAKISVEKGTNVESGTVLMELEDN